MDLFSLLFLILFLLLSLYLYFYRFQNKTTSNRGFKIYPLLGTLPEFLLNRHRFLEWTTDILSRCPTNTAVFRRPGKINGVITANPLNVEHMLKTNFENYPKGHEFISCLEDFLGRGIFNSDGELWKFQRKTASYEFNTKSLRNFIVENVTYEIKTRLLPLLKSASETQSILDLQDLLERFAFDNVCKLAFNVDPGCLGGQSSTGSEFMQVFEEAATLSCGRFLCAFRFLWKAKKFLDIGSERTLRKASRIVHDFAEQIVRSRMEEEEDDDDDKKKEDLLSRFIAGCHENNSIGFLRDICVSFILAGRDTTSSALTWFFWLLSSRPEVKQSIQKELEEIRFHSNKKIGDLCGFDELREMHYLHAAISEAMRLYPPVPVDTKACLNDDVFPDGTFVEKGWTVVCQTYAMGRMESIWGNDCWEFRPERWLQNGEFKQESPFKYPVFHAGPRMCLGKDMAYIQMKAIAASVMESFEIELVNKDMCPQHLLSLTLRMKDGLLARVRGKNMDAGN
ncbi:Cytochrome P450 [Dillenia turbinata]|uniref:Cytochrome P450 n=1 Tax=Dillenia turbinata TaxID=194707 RepID=A0AAN8ZLM9_9MAGN